MMRKGLTDLIGQKIEHKIFGECEIVEIDDISQGKFTGKVLGENTLKKFIFSSQYFNNVDEYETVQVKVKRKSTPRKYKEVDYSKYRNHPLVKEIEKKERKRKSAIPELD